MPRLNQIRVNPADVTAGKIQEPPRTPPPMFSAEQGQELKRSTIMLASLPGLGSGPDAVIRQFNGGRSVPKGRLLVP